MSRRLLERIETYITVNGAEGRAGLCKAIRKSERTLLRWLQHGVPTAHDAYTLAVAAGCGREEALELANECTPGAKRAG